MVDVTVCGRNGEEFPGGCDMKEVLPTRDALGAVY